MTVSDLVKKWQERGVLIRDGYVISFERRLSDEEKAELDEDIKTLSSN